MRRLVLASTSSYRHALLSRLGLPFSAEAPRAVDERAVVLPPEELVRHLARAKAESVADQDENALIIGSDQVAEIDGEILTQPGTAENACAQLRRLAGREHRLLTAVCVLDSQTGDRREHLDVHRIRLRQLTDAEIRDYVAREAPLDCAGAYKVESLGIALMQSLDGEDFTAIVGLPLIATARMLRELGMQTLGGAQ